MRLATTMACALLAFAVAGCKDESPSIPPAAPRGLYSVTGDQRVTLHWLRNTERDVTGYRIYEADCAGGQGCPYDRVGGTNASTDSFVVASLANGVTRYFAVAAVNRQGQESELSHETVYDTPRPAGTGAIIGNYRGGHQAGAGWDFSAETARSSTDPLADIVYSDTLGYAEMYAADAYTDIQDAGYHRSLDEIDFAPVYGWSPTGAVEMILGHCYVVWTRDNHFAKFRVTSLNQTAAVFDWAYQTAPGNVELRAERPGHAAAGPLQAAVTQR